MKLPWIAAIVGLLVGCHGDDDSAPDDIGRGNVNGPILYVHGHAKEHPAIPNREMIHVFRYQIRFLNWWDPKFAGSLNSHNSPKKLLAEWDALTAHGRKLPPTILARSWGFSAVLNLMRLGRVSSTYSGNIAFLSPQLIWNPFGYGDPDYHGLLNPLPANKNAQTLLKHFLYANPYSSIQVIYTKDDAEYLPSDILAGGQFPLRHVRLFARLNASFPKRVTLALPNLLDTRKQVGGTTDKRGLDWRGIRFYDILRYFPHDLVPDDIVVFEHTKVRATEHHGALAVLLAAADLGAIRLQDLDRILLDASNGPFRMTRQLTEIFAEMTMAGDFRDPAVQGRTADFVDPQYAADLISGTSAADPCPGKGK